LPLACRAGIGAAYLLYAEIGHQVARQGHDAISSRAVVSSRRKAWILGSRLPQLAIPSAKPVDDAAPECAFLLDSIALQRRATPALWWRLPQRFGRLIELLAQLEHRERRIARRAVMG
jgi:phytoene synthase